MMDCLIRRTDTTRGVWYDEKLKLIYSLIVDDVAERNEEMNEVTSKFRPYFTAPKVAPGNGGGHLTCWSKVVGMD